MIVLEREFIFLLFIGVMAADYWSELKVVTFGRFIM